MLFAVLAVMMLSANPIMYDQVIAVVEGEALTKTELFQEARIALVLRDSAMVAEESLSNEQLEKFLSYLIDQTLVASQARRLGGVEVTESVEAARFETFRHRFDSEALMQQFFHRYGLSIERVKQVLHRDLSNEAYLLKHVGVRSGQIATKSADEVLKQIQAYVRDMRESADIRIVNDHGQLEQWKP